MADDKLTLTVDDFAERILNPAMEVLSKQLARPVLGFWRFWLLRLVLRLPRPLRQWALLKWLKFRPLNDRQRHISVNDVNATSRRLESVLRDLDG